jgi:hypothetical protein
MDSILVVTIISLYGKKKCARINTSNEKSTISYFNISKSCHDEITE